MINRLVLRAALLTLFLAPPLSAIDPSTDRLTFTGYNAPGAAAISYLNGVYSFTFVGDETIVYQINILDPKVAGGQIIVKEVTSDSNPIDGGGFIYRDPAGNFWFPQDTHLKTTLVSHSVVGPTLTLDYVLNFNGLHPVRYLITQEQKTLRIRVIDPTVNLNVGNNFSGLTFGKTTKVETPKPIHMQGALAQPLILFRNGTKHFFTANIVDMFQSNAADYGIVDTFNPQKGADWINLNLDTVIQYKSLSNGKLPAGLDDTFVIVVSSKVKDVLLTSTAPPSPYHSLLSNRMFFDGPEKVWSYYNGMYDLYDSLGMYNLAGYFFTNWSSGAIDSPSPHNVGPDWSPAVDPNGFQYMLTNGANRGHVLSAYTAFNCIPPGASPSVSNPAQLVKDSVGNLKTYLQLGFPLVSIEAGGALAMYEVSQLKNKGATAAYFDIHTYGSLSKGPDGDHLDQQASTAWSKTMRQAYTSQKNWFENARLTMAGPLMGEGSIATPNTNMEFLWYGYVDSVQRVINSGAGMQSIQLPASSPKSPTNWPCIPEYEWRVAAQKQVNHGNGFYDRFFSKGDGSSIVDAAGNAILPLTQEARDLYNAMAIAYGHAGYVITNGTQSQHQGYITHAAAAETYFMTNALQTYFFNIPVLQIHYWYDGMFRTFEAVISKSESIEAFRKIPIAITFQNGMRIYVNLGTIPFSVELGGVTYTLPARTGWVAFSPGGLLAFSAIPPTTGGKRIDYVNATGMYEYFNGRGQVSGYGTLSTAAKRSMYKVYSSNLTVTEESDGDLQISKGPAPQLLSIQIIPAPSSLAVGSRAGLQALGVYSNGAFRDVTTLVKWFTSNGAVASVNNSGVVTALKSGVTTITTGTLNLVSATPITLSIP